jgi:predicted GNAT superfamily acetyltransferase
VSYDIRPFRTIEEFHDCVALQEETWGHGFSERVAPAILKVAQILGGVSAGAYDDDGSLVGFVFGMTGVRNGEVVHWSDMLAVRRGIRDTGLGTRLKAYQRETLLERGVTKMYWTFDPLQSRNAYLNFSKLGIVVREYARDMYGQTDSPLHRGIGTDRFIALWLMDTERVARRVGGAERGPDANQAGAAPSALEEKPGGAPLPEPGVPDLTLEGSDVRVAVPSDISEIMATSMDLAVAWREATRSALTHYLAHGFEVREFLRGQRTSHYLLIRESRP